MPSELQNSSRPAANCSLKMRSSRPHHSLGTPSALCRAFTISLLIVISGCGENDEIGRVEVNGEVTLNGVPVKAGRLNFIPEGETKGPATGTKIVNGTYSIERERGPVPGQYLVRVQVADSDTTAPDNPTRPPTKEEILAGTREPQVDTPQETQASRSESDDEESSREFHVTVTAEGPNTFALPIGKKAADK